MKFFLVLLLIPSFLFAKELQTKMYNYKNLYFAGQPEAYEYALLKDKGIQTVINIRTKGEYDEASERKQVKAAGLDYYNIPFNIKNFNQETIDSVTKQVVESRKKGGVLIHCRSGGRVGIWLGAHFFKDHHYSKEDSVKIAKEHGLTKEMPLNILKEFLGIK